MKERYIFALFCLLLGAVLGFGIGWKYAENKLVRDINTFIKQELQKLEDSGQGLLFNKPGTLEYQNNKIVERK